MILHDEAQSIVSLHSIFCDKILFERSEQAPLLENLKMHFTTSYQFDEAHTSCLVKLACFIKDESSENVRMEVSVTGEFSCECEDAERRDALLQKNTMAILFPYLRTQVSVITMQPGMDPIVIPPMNIEALFDKTVHE